MAFNPSLCTIVVRGLIGTKKNTNKNNYYAFGIAVLGLAWVYHCLQGLYRFVSVYLPRKVQCARVISK
ncbi:hypothetical protein BDV35DRAFT_341201 [Aspergillus flavus]|uniref:Uncharacterized protein n=1 Tax=Aspergillus flavus TaxID=5059 RepID=A0A5N6H8E2_ASPFL|nr:hypothetical protein BDV35DRAFT_341201 [Aspergillus flavus]